MSVLSVLRTVCRGIDLQVLKPGSKIALSPQKFLPLKSATCVQLRYGSHGPRIMPIRPSQWHWNKFKDLLHYYIMVGAIPLTILIFSVNVFVGPAKLAVIPEGYEPKHWEYYRHPITRFLARYWYPPPQQEYEKYMHFLFEQNQKKQMRMLERDVKQKIGENEDFQSYYYRPVVGKYHRIQREATKRLKEEWGS